MASSVGFIPHCVIPRGPNIIRVKLYDEFLASKESLPITRVVDQLDLLFFAMSIFIEVELEALLPFIIDGKS